MAVDTPTRSRKIPVQLDRDQILDTAQRIAVAEGTRALTLRRLGDELGVDHTAVYRHFGSKEEIIDAVIDRLITMPPPISDGDDWRAATAQRLRVHLDRFDIHPELAQRVAVRADRSAAALSQAEHIMEALSSRGLPMDRVAEIFEMSDAIVAGVGIYLSLWKHEIRGKEEQIADDLRVLAAVDPTKYPRIVEAAPHLGRTPSEVADLVVELLLTTIERAAPQHGENT